MLYLNKL